MIFSISSIKYLSPFMGADPAAGGTTTPAVGGHSYSEGEIVPITASANPGYRFVNWTGDVADPNSESTTVTMDADKTVTANFEETGLGPEPAFISLDPDAGTSSVGTPRIFSLVVGDGDGYEDIEDLTFAIKEGVGIGTEPGALVFAYWRNYNMFVLWDNTAGRWVGGRPGQDRVLETDLCTFDVSQTTVEGDGDQLTINWHVTPKEAFTGVKRIWLDVRDSDGNRIRNVEIGAWSVNP